MTKPPEVTICIPTWRAENFIERTLNFARDQTYESARILISVDLSDDRTAEICLEYAEIDPRIKVIVQPKRLGWSRNSNFLLDNVETEFFFLYFHDDIILPTYTEKLLLTLLENPEAMSIHCDLERFGCKNDILPGNYYYGSDTRRLINFLVGPTKGTPLRSLTRSKILSQGLRFAEIGTDSFWRCHPFLLTLVASGPALHYPEVLYRRWIREDRMTATWSPKSIEELIDGQQQNAERCLKIINDIEASDIEKEMVRFSLYLFILNYTRALELNMDAKQLISPAEISPVFDSSDMPSAFHDAESDVQEWIDNAIARLEELEKKFFKNRSSTN